MQQAVDSLEAIARAVTIRRGYLRDDETSSQTSSSSSTTAASRRSHISLEFQSATLQAMERESGSRELIMLLAQDTQDIMIANQAMFVSMKQKILKIFFCIMTT
jgi:hypothetical protein